MLEIKDLHARVAETEEEILKGVNLTINTGEIHAVMGPNGSGKSTLANVIAGRPDYEITKGDVLYNGESIIEETPDVRAQRGLFMAAQYPTEIPGVRPWQFLKLASDTVRKSQGMKPLTVREFSKEFDAAAQIVGLSPDLMKRSLNEGFSGGEKKRNEVLQMLVLKPAFCILDETDSGLDVDALKLVGESVNSIRSDQNAFLVVTHYNRVLKHIKPDVVHILRDGRIVKTGDPKLALEIEEHGYEILNRD